MRYLNAGFAAALLLVSPISSVALQGEVVQAQTVQDRKAEGSSKALKEANRLWEKGSQQDQANNYPEAIQLWEKALVIYQQLEDINSEAKTLSDLGYVYQRLSQYDQATTYYQRALLLYQQLKNRSGEAKALANLGIAYGLRAQYDKAIICYQQALPIFQQVKDLSGKANVLNNLGDVYQSLSQYDQAITYYQQARTLSQQIKDYNGEANALNNLGVAYRSLSQYGKATTYYQQALSLFKQVKDLHGEASALVNLGVAYWSLSQYGKAITYYQQALSLFKQVKDLHGEASTLVNLGIAYQSLSQYGKAITYYQQALSLFQQVKDRNGAAKALNNLGYAYGLLLQYDKAISYYQQALPLFQQVKNRNDEANALMNLGTAYQLLLQYDKAIAYYQQALPLFQQVKNRNGEANALGNLGSAYGLLSQYDKAITYYQQALPLFQQVEDRQGEGSLFNNLGYLLTQRNNPELAIVFYKQSVNVRESIRQDIRKLPRESQEAYAQSVAGTYRSLADLLIQQGRLPEAQAVLELLKLRELRDFTRDAGIDSSGINLARVEDAALTQILQRYTTIGALSQKIDACEQTHCPELQQLQDQRDRLNQAVTAELTQQRAILTKYFSTESATITPDKLTPEALDIVNAQPGTVLIYPLILKDKMQFLVALKAGDGAVVLRPFETRVSAETLFKTIQTFREQLQAPGNLAALQATSQQLYTWLIKPLEPELNNPAIKHLVFAPDSTTRYIPLAALFDGKRYLVERYSISTITAASGTDTSETFAQLPVNDTFLLAVGASTFANANPLENVPAELDAIVKPPNSPKTQGIYPGVELLNTQFDFDALKANLKGHRVLHIATHGRFQPGRVEDSYLLPGRGQNLTTTLIDQLGNYGLRGIHLVVLSACETAVGDRASDGIEIPGISYFFLKNKVKAVMASLWSVNDASTSLMMQQFYQQLATGKTTKAEALQLVQQQFITGKLTAKDAPSRSPILIPKGNPQTRQSANGDFSHPFYWAPFILIGNSL